MFPLCHSSLGVTLLSRFILDLRGLNCSEDAGLIRGAGISRFMSEVRFISSRAVGNIGNLEDGDRGDSAANPDLEPGIPASILAHQGVDDSQAASGENRRDEFFHMFPGGCSDVSDQVADTPGEASGQALPVYVQATRNTDTQASPVPVYNYTDHANNRYAMHCFWVRVQAEVLMV